MTLDEIFTELGSHMVEGLMFHSQMSDYFGFIGLDKYQEAHRKHFIHESKNYKKLGSYYLHHYNKLIKENSFVNPSVVPDSWFQYTRHDVNATTRKNAIQVAAERWVNWEKETKSLYERMYNELISIGEVASAQEITKYVKDVDLELAEATQSYIELTAMDFSISDIIMEQREVKE